MSVSYEFVDAFGMVGRSGYSQPFGLGSTHEVLEEASRCGVSRVLAHHAIAREWDPLTGNALLQKEMATDDRIMGAWVVEPIDAYRPHAATSQVDRMLNGGFAAARMFPDPGSHNYDLGGRGVVAFLEACAERRIPVFIETEYPDWRVLDEILQATGVSIVLTGISYRRSRNLYPLLDAHPRLLVETSTFVAHRGLEDVVDRFGSGRLVFGTRLPQYAAGAAVARVLLADLPQAEKAAIAGGTLIELLRRVAS